MKLNKFLLLGVVSTGLLATSCEDFLDRAPITSITPEQYFKQDTELAAYTLNYYNSVLKSPIGGFNAGAINWDDETDNMVVGGGDIALYNHEWLVSAGQTLDFGTIRAINYFLQQAEAKNKEGKISGDPAKVKHYIGEGYYMRASLHFDKLKSYGDFPYVDQVYVDDKAILQEASRRLPRNEVARKIIADLETAEGMLLSGTAFNKNRIGKELATLMKARVALFEATFLKYHKGTPRVPGEAGWPGAAMSYNQGKTFNIDAEIDYFLGVAMEASKEIADATTLTENSYVIQPERHQHTGWNPYFEMFSMPNPAPLSEVILWRDFDASLSITSGWLSYILEGGNNGMTKSYVDAFLMEDGLPIYASEDYQGDETIKQQVAGRDGRLQLFMFNEDMMLYNTESSDSTFSAPGFFLMAEHRDLTGFRQRKHFTYDPKQSEKNSMGTDGFVEFRGAEAFLIYIEASYLKEEKINATADKYWRAIRTRAGVDPDYQKTISATKLELEPDWAKYSGSETVDLTLYNIRRERRCEFIGEGFRKDDLKRWRAYDGLLEGGEFHGYQPKGVNFWTSMYKHESYYDRTTGKSLIKEQGPGVDANMSNSSLIYVYPYKLKEEGNQLWDGLKWQKAHYLSPLGIMDLSITAEDNTLEGAQTYQNPYWPTQAAQAATE